MPNNISHETQNNYVQLLPNYVQLKYFKLKTQYDIDLNNFTSLSRLVITSSEISDKSIEKLSQLTELNVKRNDKINCIKNLTNLEAFHGDFIDLSFQTKLKTVELSNELRKTIDEINNSLKSLKSSIKTIEKLYLYYESMDIKIVEEMINLTDLEIFLSNETPLDITKLSNLKYIETKNVVLTGKVSSYLQNIDAEMYSLSTNSCIENPQCILSLCNSERLKKVSLKGVIIENFGPNIEKLVNSCKINRKDMTMLKNNSHKLVHLDTSYKSNITPSIINNNFYDLISLKLDTIDSTIVSLNNLKKLRKLRLIDCNVEEECIENLKLIKLDLSHIDKNLLIDSSDMKSLIISYCPNQQISLKNLEEIKRIKCGEKWANNNIEGYKNLLSSEINKKFRFCPFGNM